MKKIMMMVLSLMVATSMSVPVFAQPAPESSTADIAAAGAEAVVYDEADMAALAEPAAEQPTDPTTADPTQPTQPTQPSTQPAAPKKLTSTQALNTALKNAKLARSAVRGVEVELDDGIYEIEFTRKSNRAEYGYEVIPSNGKIIKKSIDFKYKKSKSKKKISKTKVRKKVAKFAGVPYSAVKKGRCKLDRDDGVRKYEVYFSYKGLRYNVETLAKNGKVIEYEWKR